MHLFKTQSNIIHSNFLLKVSSFLNLLFSRVSPVFMEMSKYTIKSFVLPKKLYQDYQKLH